MTEVLGSGRIHPSSDTLHSQALLPLFPSTKSSEQGLAPNHFKDCGRLRAKYSQIKDSMEKARERICGFFSLVLNQEKDNVKIQTREFVLSKRREWKEKSGGGRDKKTCVVQTIIKMHERDSKHIRWASNSTGRHKALLYSPLKLGCHCDTRWYWASVMLCWDSEGRLVYLLQVEHPWALSPMLALLNRTVDTRLKLT